MKISFGFIAVVSLVISILFYCFLPKFENCFSFYLLQSLESLLISIVEYMLIDYYLNMNYTFLGFFNPFFDIV